MDWYKLFQIAIPSITAVGTAALGYYLWYFKKKFGTYGAIDAKLQKLDKLEEIEKRLASANFDAQIDNIDKILELSKAQAYGKSSAEFEYQKRKDDSDKLVEFWEDILNSFEINREINSQLEGKLRLNGQIKNEVFTLQMDYFTEQVIHDLEKSIKADDYYKLMSMIKVKHIVYFEKYDNSFNVTFEKWQNEMNILNTSRIELISNMQMQHHYSENPTVDNKRITDLVDSYSYNNLIKSKNLPEINDQLSNVFKNLTKKIRDDKRFTSHNADYV